MSPDDRRAELLADRALQGLSPAERRELARLLGGADVEADPEALALELAAAEAQLALNPIGFEAPPDTLLDQLGRGADAFPAGPKAAPGRRPIAARAVPWLGWVAAAASLLFNFAAQAPRPGPAPTLADRLAGVAAVPLSATDHPLARGGGGSLVWSGDRQEGYLSLRGLAESEPDRGVYQLWIFDATRDERFPVDGGTFTVLDARSTTLVPIRPPLPARRPTLFAVTLEPPGGVVVSDRKRVLLTAAPAPAHAP